MNLNDRKKEIFDILCSDGKISVAMLAKKLYVSEMTIRRDLCEMEKNGILKRYRGGAVLTIHEELPISERFWVDEKYKKMLGKQAAEYVEEGYTIYIDSSSTCQYIIPHLGKFKNITIITNSVKVLMIASGLQIRCILIGGQYYAHDMCFVGSIAEQNAAHFNVDVSFFSTLAISHDGIISDNDIEQTTIRKVIMDRAKKKIFLFEPSKLGKKYFYTLCRDTDADAILFPKDD